MSAMKRAALYLRVSTAAQANRGHEPEGYSIPAQREACQAKATELEAEVVAEYVDRGESAKTADRPELKALLQGSRPSAISTAWSSTRSIASLATATTTRPSPTRCTKPAWSWSR